MNAIDKKYLTRVTPENIPAELKAHKNWCVWTPRYRDNGKIEKRPLTPNTGKAARTNCPLTWGTFPEAIAARDRSDVFPLGIEYILDGRHKLVGVDLDECRRPDGTLELYAALIIERLDTYTEWSPSGKGIRMFIHGTIPENCKSSKIEIYDHHAVTLTGDIYGTPKPIRECQDDLDALLTLYFPNKMSPDGIIARRIAAAGTQQPAICPNYEAEEDDEVTARKLCGDPERAALWYGDSSIYGGDISRGDAALIRHLAYWSNSTDPADLDRLFRKSGRMRPKWDEVHSADGLTYGQMTIRMVVNSMRGTK
jgi:putative DNA primase/helicase